MCSFTSLIRQGTSIRRTNETDMNAQSSRSHAIFSLTLTQKKYTGSGPPPRSSSPLPPGGRSPSRIARPGSVVGPAGGNSRVSSPTFGRPSTPSFQSAIARGGRPASSLGFLSPDMARNSASKDTGDSSGGEWVTVVSKFHFVDLAGSERVSRFLRAGLVLCSDRLPVEAHGCRRRAYQGGYLHQQRPSSVGQRHLRPRRSRASEVSYGVIRSLPRLQAHSSAPRFSGR